MITAKEIYKYYHQQTFYIEKKIYPKSIVNWDKIENGKNWHYFEKFARRLNENDNIDYKILITSLCLFYKKRFNPKDLISLRGIKIYKNFVNKINAVDTIEKIEQVVINNIKNIVQYCRKNKLNSFDEYFSENFYTIPTLARHLNSGYISKFFLSIVPHIEKRLKTYPNDVYDEYFYDFVEDFILYKQKTLKNQKIQKFAIKFNKNFNKLIMKVKND